MAPQVQAQLVITLTDDGQINVNGPLANKVLCYGMLEIARDVVQSHQQTPGPKLVVAPAGSVPPPPRTH